MAAPILSYEDLGLIQGEGWLFRGLDLYIGERDRLALIGRNGAGKTTLLKCLAAMIDPDEGKRTIVPGSHVVLLEQDPVMDGFATLQDWVLHGPDAPERHDAEAIAQQLGIDLSRPTGTASGGERRRAEITRALVISPKFILLDEPFAGIDPIAVTDIQKIIFHLKDRGIGVLITDHNVRETLRITDRAYIVHGGVIFKSGTPDSLAADEEVRRIYLGTEFRLD